VRRCGRRPRRQRLGRSVRQLHSHVRANLIFSLLSGYRPDRLNTL
jgi:hypothetical protein